MSVREQIRPGGRSARVQASVHKATRDLLVEVGRDEVSIPAIADRAGVTPSTIYRRWGDLQAVLSDVAVERFRAEEGPTDTGNPRRDLETWVRAYAEEMSSVPGQEMVRDVLASRTGGNPAKCCGYTREQITEIVGRAEAGGLPFPQVDEIMDHVIAPITYRVLFLENVAADECLRLIDFLFRCTTRGCD